MANIKDLKKKIRKKKIKAHFVTNRKFNDKIAY